jgi:hypothetical protein
MHNSATATAWTYSLAREKAHKELSEKENKKLEAARRARGSEYGAWPR